MFDAVKPGSFDQETDSVFKRGGVIPCDAIKHFIGKCGRYLRRLEALSGAFIGVVDSVKYGADAYIYGPREGVAMLLHVFACTHEGFYTVLSSLEWAFMSLG